MKLVSLPQDRQDESGNDAEERIVALPGGGIKSASDLLEKQFFVNLCPDSPGSARRNDECD